MVKRNHHNLRWHRSRIGRLNVFRNVFDDERIYNKDETGHYDRDMHEKMFSDDRGHSGSGSGGLSRRYQKEYDPSRYDHDENTKHNLNQFNIMGNGKNNSPDFDIRRDFEQGKGYANYGSSEGAGDNYGAQDQETDRTGANTWFSSEKTNPAHKDDGARNHINSDDRIKEEVCDRLYDDGSIDATNINVKVQKCEVTLSGFVNDDAASNRAGEIAKSVDGVTNIDNRLSVKTVLGNEPTPPEGNTDIGNKISIGSNVVPSPGGQSPVS